MARTTYYVGGAPQFVADRDTIQQDGGRQIDWTQTDDNTSLPAGSIMAVLSSGKLAWAGDPPGAETATHILLTDANQDDEAASLSGYATIVGGVIYSNLLPDSGETDFSDWLDELAAVGVGNFSWQTAADNTA